MTSQVHLWVGLELKYCEQCGGLWLRPRGSGQCYCAACAHFLEDMPPRARDNRRRGGSGPLRRRMRKQQREPGTELAPLEYVVAARQQEENKARQMQMTTGPQPLAAQENAYESR